MIRRTFLQMLLASPLAGLLKGNKVDVPTIVCSEFFDRDGVMFASFPGIGNVVNCHRKGPIIKRTKWSDGSSFDEIWGSSTYGINIGVKK